MSVYSILNRHHRLQTTGHHGQLHDAVRAALHDRVYVAAHVAMTNRHDHVARDVVQGTPTRYQHLTHHQRMCIHINTCIYIYIYIYIHFERVQKKGL